MFDDKNPYSLRSEIVGGLTRYFVSFTDGQGVRRETRVSRPVYLEFLRFVRIERNLQRWDERHVEMSEITDSTLYRRALHPPKSLEETIFDSISNKKLRLVIQNLPEIQRRRFVLRHEFGLTYKQIAEIEGAKRQTVTRSIYKAEKEIKKIFFL